MDTVTDMNNLRELIRIMALLRSENGCQWDRQQTPDSLKKHILEETYELLEAIDQGDPAEICDELGDLLLQVVFQAQIFSETGQFDIEQVAKSISSKLKRRHPHIFAGASKQGHEKRWEEIKVQELSERGLSDLLAQRIPPTLPALKRATKLIRKTEQPATQETFRLLQKQLEVLEAMISPENSCRAELEGQLGEVLLQVCRFSAAANLDPEDLLRQKTTQMITEIDIKN